MPRNNGMICEKGSAMYFSFSTVNNAPRGVTVISDKNKDLIAWIIPRGARIMQLFLRVKNQSYKALCLGFSEVESYNSDRFFLGAICGRYANRIGNGVIVTGEKKLLLDINHPMGHTIHGGSQGFSNYDWKIERTSSNSCCLSIESIDGDQGFPGACLARCVYSIEKTQFKITLEAEVDKNCPLNLVQHAYFCFSENGKASGHFLEIPAKKRLQLGLDELPTFAVPVSGQWFDFTKPKLLSDLSQTMLESLDNCYILRTECTQEPKLSAVLSTDQICLRISSTEPSVQVYTSANLKPASKPLGYHHKPGSGICLECEEWPNGPALNRPVWFGPHRPYKQITIWDFLTLQ